MTAPHIVHPAHVLGNLLMRVGRERQLFFNDASIGVLDNALFLNRAAIAAWPDRSGIQYFSEAATALREAVAFGDGGPDELRHLALILHDGAQLKTFEAWVGHDDLPGALDDAGEAVRLLASLVESSAVSPFSAPRVLAKEMRGDLVAMILTRARVEMACGLIDDAQQSLTEARDVAQRCGPGGEWWEWVEVVGRELAPVQRLGGGGGVERRLWIWVS